MKHSLVLTSLTAVTISSAILCFRSLSVSADDAACRGEDITPCPLMIPAEDLNLGILYESSHVAHRFRVRNDSQQTVTIKWLSPSCNCVDVKPDSAIVLEAGGTCVYDAKLNLERPAGRTSPSSDAAGLPRLHIGYEIGGQTRRTHEWQFQGTVLPSIVLEQAVLRLGVLSDQSEDLERTVELSAASEIVSIDCETPTRWTAQVEPRQQNGGHFRVVLRHQTPLTPHSVADEIKFVPIHRDGRRLEGKILRVTGEILTDLTTSPPQMHFGRQPAGSVQEEAVRLYSRTGRAFHVLGVSTPNQRLTVDRLSGSEDVYSLRLTVRVGDDDVAATFRVRDDAGAETQVAVPVRCLGVVGSP
ncbi:MAG: hypothetical protein U0746_05330 [Gemmataceae bacterium]